MSVNIKSDIFYHNSHDSFYRRPFGAAECGSFVTLRLMAPIGFWGQCTLRLWINDEEVLVPMKVLSTFGADGQEDGAPRTIFETVYRMPEAPCLVWYYFCILHDRSAEFYGDNEESLGGEGKMYQYSPNSFQITVHKPSKTPDWWKEGCIYQIFPDRFCNGNQDGSMNAVKPGSLLQASWYDRPSYQKDAKGNIMNWIFAGGNLKGVTSKLDYLQSLGVTILYFNPIFEARSSHRYDVGDYHRIDPVLGDQADFDQLIRETKRRGISVILDGVFSHTGVDSVYFNKFGNYGEGGAYQDPQSEYASWYHFTQFPDQYECWWNFPDLPTLDKENQSYLDFIAAGEDSVVRKWLRAGVKGFRLDVADELPDDFLRMLRKVSKEENKEAILLGEVWEDASNKTSYNVLKQYFSGEELDGVMNYPFYETIVAFALGQLDGKKAFQRIMSFIEKYPRENLLGCMTLLGSHDRPRILSVLSERVTQKGQDLISLSEYEKQHYTIPEKLYREAVTQLKMLSALQIALPGTPSLYYGDEAGMQGFMDPYNRGTFPWGREDAELQSWYRELFKLRKHYLAEMMDGEFSAVEAPSQLLAFRVQKENTQLIVVSNSGKEPAAFSFQDKGERDTVCVELITGSAISQDENKDNSYTATIPAESTQLLYMRDIHKPNVLKRSGGILLHPTSLPGKWLAGDLGANAYEFVDTLHRAGQSLWQILPLHPPAAGDSPYQTFSCFAGNPLLISMEKMQEDGYVTAEEVDAAYMELEKHGTANDSGLCDFSAAKEIKAKLFRKAYGRVAEDLKKNPKYKEYRAFCLDNTFWIWDFGLYCALKDFYGGLPWNKWPDDALRTHEISALRQFSSEHEDKLGYHIFVQFLFFEQWRRLKTYAEEKGISIVGDVSFYAGEDSADVWSSPKLFALDSDGKAKEIGGVPPDYFCEDGQLWGTPVYNWDTHKKQNYNWWVSRIKHGLKLHHYIRLDHFRGFEAFWSVPAQAKTAREGKWESGPEVELFLALERELGSLPFIAEDLGEITPAVHRLKNLFQLPGMEIYQFSHRLQQGMEDDLQQHSVLYTGTHDNDTLAAWSGKEDPEAEVYTESVVSQLYESKAEWVMVPAQDILSLGAEARMNVPGSVGGRNWRWRMTPEDWKHLQDREEYLWQLVQKTKRGKTDGQ